MIPDLDMIEARIAAMRELPWPIPAQVVMQMTDEDLDRLDAAWDTDGYWHVLNEIVSRIKGEEAS